jgi:hypothetical protein
MEVFRLVHRNYDPVEEGEFLTRSSCYSREKIAHGIYFTPSRDEALTFAKQPHRHTYSHLLTCSLVGVSLDDVVDLVADPNLIVKWNRGRYPKRRDAAEAFCRENKKKAILWETARSQKFEGWTELCLLTEHIPNTVLIIGAEELELPHMPS